METITTTTTTTTTTTNTEALLGRAEKAQIARRQYRHNDVGGPPRQYLDLLGGEQAAVAAAAVAAFGTPHWERACQLAFRCANAEGRWGALAAEAEYPAIRNRIAAEAGTQHLRVASLAYAAAALQGRADHYGGSFEDYLQREADAVLAALKEALD